MIDKVLLKSFSLDEYLKAVKELKGEKVKFKNPIPRTIYEEKSLLKGKWLTLKEFEEMI